MRVFLGRLGRSHYVRADLLRAADVVVTRSRASVSKGIAALTLGPFSHAAMVVGPTVHFESDDAGVGYTYIGLSKIERHANEIRWLWHVTNCPRVAVLRHPNLRKLSVDAERNLASRLQEIFTPFAGLQYPSLDVVANASDLLNGYPVVKRGILALLERLYSDGQTKVLPGPFCSQLVALCFEQLGYPIFKARTEPGRVSPNMLANHRISHLRRVPDVLTRPNRRITNDQEFLQLLSTTRSIGKNRELAREQTESRVAVESIYLARDRLFRSMTKVADSLRPKNADA